MVHRKQILLYLWFFLFSLLGNILRFSCELIKSTKLKGSELFSRQTTGQKNMVAGATCPT